jgi:hypothetical protein
VVNYLGTATPQGAYLFPFFLAFTFAMTAMRVLICWLYTNIKSVLITELMHISSSGSLVIFSPPAVSARQELIWYGTLWRRVMDRRSNRGKTIRHPPGSLTAIQKGGSTDSRLGRLKNAHPRVRITGGVPADWLSHHAKQGVLGNAAVPSATPSLYV